MTAAADLVLRGGDIHVGGETYGALAVRDGRVVRRSNEYEGQFLTGVETEVVDLDGRTVLPGFVDPRAELGGVDSLRERARTGVTAVHAVTTPERAAECRDAAGATALPLRVRLQYPETLRSSLLDAGLRTNHGELVEVGGLRVPVEAGFAERALAAAEAGFQVVLEAATPEEAEDAAAALADCRGERHVIEGAVPRSFGAFGGVVVTDGGTDGLARVLDSDATLALGGGDPLRTVARAVESGLAPEAALRAHTRGGRIAGFAEGSAAADFVAFDGDLFDDPGTAAVALTVSRGAIVYDALD